MHHDSPSYHLRVIAQPPSSSLCFLRLHFHPTQPYPHPPSTSAINTLQAIRYSSVLSAQPNHLYTLGSTQLASCLSIPNLLSISSFLTLSIRVTPPKPFKHYKTIICNNNLSQLCSLTLEALRSRLVRRWLSWRLTTCWGASCPASR